MYTILTIFLISSVICATTNSSPITPRRVKFEDTNGNGKIKYDQRQEGQWNVRADLQNFVILIIPTLPSPPSLPSSSATDVAALGLLDLLSKAIPPKKRKHIIKKDEENEEHATVDTTEHFKELKTAPYHVDIGKTIEKLGKMGNGVITVNADDNSEVHEVEIPIMRSYGKHSRGSKRNMKAFMISVPIKNAHAQISKDGSVSNKKEFGEKITTKKNLSENSNHDNKRIENDLLLIGAENEQCGPNQNRDKDGICRS